jgi:SAM-dependent methyltransferase
VPWWDAEVPELSHDSFPRSSRYASDWLLSLDMGPNPLWLLEDLLRDMTFEPGSRVLDLGCGRGATSVFLAKEVGAAVWAVDLWVPSADIEITLAEAGVQGSVHAANADARNLPFEDGFFDAIVCIDAWEYLGTDDHFLPRLLRVLAPGGRLGMATPAMLEDARDLGRIPEHIRSVVGWEALAWHPPAWWEQQWELTGLMTDVVARAAERGWDNWLRWSVASAERRSDGGDPVVEMLRADGGELLTFSLVSGRKR